MVPWVENGCLQRSQPPAPERLDAWLRARVQVTTRPDWFFVKLHTHGCEEPCTEVLLGEPMLRLHEALAERSARDPSFQFHYVTAREMYNLARAAEDGWQGSVVEARDHVLTWNEGAGGRSLPGDPRLITSSDHKDAARAGLGLKGT